MKKNRKFTIAIGTLVAICSPIFIVSCSKVNKKKIKEKFDFADDLEKIKLNPISSKDITALRHDLGSKEVGDEVTLVDLGINIPKFTTGVIAKYTIYHDWLSNSQIDISVTLTKGSDTRTWSFIVNAKKFDFRSDLAKFQSFHSTKNLTNLRGDFIGTKILFMDTKVTAKRLGIVTPSVSPGVKVLYHFTMYNRGTYEILVTLTLEYKKFESTGKKFIVISKFPISLNNIEKMKEKFTSRKDKMSLELDVGYKKVGEIVTSANLGLLSYFPSDVKVTYIVKKTYDLKTKSIIVTATFMKDGESATKDITISAKFNFSDDWPKTIPGYLDEE